jgi:DNA processing protein
VSGHPRNACLPGLPAAAYAVALTCLPGVGPAWLVEVLAQYSPEQAWEMVLTGQLGRPSKSRPGTSPPGWAEAARQVDAGVLWASCRRNEIRVTWPGQPAYPTAFAGGPAPPGVLFIAGQPATFEDRPCVAVVGTRRCTPDGAAAAYELGYDLSKAGVCVVSGLALGIDGAAHAGALAAVRDLEELGEGAQMDGRGTGSTVGVAASGVDVVYPRRHRGLWREVVSLGAVVSETPPGCPAQAWRFPSRNRVIAGLARIVVVVESHASGGSWHTVDAAIRRGIEVGAVPGPIHSSASAGTNTLLHEGATPIRSAQDVLDSLGMFEDRGRGTSTRPKPAGAAGRFGDCRGPGRAASIDLATSPGRRRASPSPPSLPGAPRSSVRPPAPGPTAQVSPLAAPQPVAAPLGALEETVRSALGWRPLCLEEIVERSGLPAGAVVVALDRLQDEDLAVVEAGWWSRKGR